MQCFLNPCLNISTANYRRVELIRPTSLDFFVSEELINLFTVDYIVLCTIIIKLQ